jgi:hypothetical protein
MPLFDTDGSEVGQDVDRRIESEFNNALERITQSSLLRIREVIVSCSGLCAKLPATDN